MNLEQAQKLTENPRVRAFLDMIGESEGADYRTLVYGKRKNALIADLSRHPNRLVRNSTAAGKYQFLNRTWKRFAAALKLPDFSPQSQDLAAVAQLAEVGAIQPILAGDIPTAINKARKIWASFPGAGYGQNEHGLKQMLAWYNAAAGQVSSAVNLITENGGTSAIALAVVALAAVFF